MLKFNTVRWCKGQKLPLLDGTTIRRHKCSKVPGLEVARFRRSKGWKGSKAPVLNGARF